MVKWDERAIVAAILICALLVAFGCATYARLPVQAPPERFKVASTPVVYLEVGKVAERCEPFNAACANPIPVGVVGPEWTVVTPDPCAYPDQSYARLLCRELAHAKGWKHERQ